MKSQADQGVISQLMWITFSLISLPCKQWFRSLASGLEKTLLAGYLYADDLVIFSRSAKGLQNIFLISKLESFCDFADLDVNINKTKVMIFNNCGKSLNNY